MNVYDSRAIRPSKNRARAWVALPVLCALSITATIAAAPKATAQSENDVFSSQSNTPSYGNYNAHAACDSTTLPQAGFKIATPVPGRDGECYWTRSEEPITTLAKPPPAPALPPHLKTAQSAPEALQLARQFYETRLDFIRRQRSEALSRFMASLTGCGVNIDCHVQTMSVFQQKQDKLSSDQTWAMGQLVDDIGKIRTHYRMPGDWPGNPFKTSP